MLLPTASFLPRRSLWHSHKDPNMTNAKPISGLLLSLRPPCPWLTLTRIVWFFPALFFHHPNDTKVSALSLTCFSDRLFPSSYGPHLGTDSSRLSRQLPSFPTWPPWLQSCSFTAQDNGTMITYKMPGLTVPSWLPTLLWLTSKIFSRRPQCTPQSRAQYCSMNILRYSVPALVTTCSTFCIW